MAKVDIAKESRLCSRWNKVPGAWMLLARLLLLLVLPSCFSFSQTSKATESQVKAAYLFNFGKFVTWPSDQTASSDSFEICVIGKDPFGPVLDETVKGEKISGKKVSIRRISRIGEGRACNIAFISSSEESRLPGIIEEAARMHVLTVSDIPHFAERGGTIGLVNLDDRIRFEVNRTRAAQSHLGLSSELLKVAVKVIGGASAGS